MGQPDFIYGRKVFVDFLKGKRSVEKVYLIESAFRSLKGKINRVHIPYKIVGRDVLFKLSGRRDHQGVVAFVSSFRYVPLESFLVEGSYRLVLLDRITDVRNTGSIIRSAHILGFDGVIISERGGAKVTPAVVHTSACATEFIPIHLAASIPDTLDTLKRKGFCIFCADMSGVPLNEITSYPERVVLVLGSEGGGHRVSVLSRCDNLIGIPQKGEIDSLNVSVAAGIIMHDMMSKEM
ncbi:MAG: hypothetical protein B6D65_03425 [candidate division Zixibacteria bacterium 4484_93]|nr:MAG: hypothetical protein B6D65_03425 [candidate division Zixibacteria bacterium 4484_93]RKZ33523.1 MAG: hypothetical protein DRQ19_02760 [bacterium]